MAPESRQLWLVGGTRESVALAEAIALLNIACLVTVVTPAAICQYPTGQKLQVQAVKLHPHTVSQFLQQAKIAAILDASHPFATAVSQLAIAAAEAARIPYLRYERPQLEAVYGDSIESLETLLSGSLLYQQRVLLTLGYRWLHHFTPWQSKATLFARILPSLEALEAAIAAGFSPERIIALRPPISAELEAALWQQWQISQVVTKASGAAGGEAIKQQVAQQLGVQLITIRRPAIAYPHQTSHLSTALAFCQQSVSRLC
ncbi:MAG: cobalt-precorrin-6A reductase [Leptolyngbyaceae cyanobacterium SL_1_1]|nr:cobalt-precorrin-6A reductase [Leptolyngbyaceae cyanobacterium RM1_1_2]NJO10081.1 cobalt-precorrin-6A reductase [Leptolyngbyaceae cyanobacterium SL_1_1]